MTTNKQTKISKELKEEMNKLLNQKVNTICKESIYPIINEQIIEKTTDLMSELSNFNTGNDKLHELVFNKIHKCFTKGTIKQLRESKK
jgi:formylmethanofuran:tetrahydromethanopterin formyltransferase